MTYRPSTELLERYASILVHYGLANGAGIKPGETVQVRSSEDAKPLFFEVCKEIWRAGGNVIQTFMPADDAEHNFSAAFYELASDAQLDHFSEPYYRGLLEQIDHIIFILGERDPKALEGVDAAKISRHGRSQARSWEFRLPKERAGNLHWTIGMYGTEAQAAEAGMTLEQYWDQIIRACFLDDPDPVARWKQTAAEVRRYRDWLNSLAIDRLHVEAEEIDLWLTLGEQRRWISADGKNIPSFEVFTTPDWRGTNGRVRFSEPLYYQGSLIRGIELDFKDGEVVRAGADENGELIQAMVRQPGANRLGEYSLTDARSSRIDRFMADTLYDENMGGPFGNTHMALGIAITEAFDGDESAVSDAEWERLGFNVGAALHCDIVSTTDRTVTATLKDGSTRVVYERGRFQTD
ncbi:MAG: aminopeptidase [Solirubrobacterales bacterium]|nr:aminopeptidase [Solirubrobacterales bacterium]